MAGSNEDDDMAGNAWPGFVDILSATVIMFVFFVMVVVVVLYIYTIKFTAEIKSDAERKVKMSQEKIERLQSDVSLDELKKQKFDTMQEIEELNKTLQEMKDNVQQMSSGISNPESQKVIFEDNEIIIVFDDQAITFSEEVIQEVKDILDRFGRSSVLDITAGDEPDSAKQFNRRNISLGRLMNARNIALALDYESNNISVRYAPYERIENSYQWVRIKIRD